MRRIFFVLLSVTSIAFLVLKIAPLSFAAAHLAKGTNSFDRTAGSVKNTFHFIVAENLVVPNKAELSCLVKSSEIKGVLSVSKGITLIP